MDIYTKFVSGLLFPLHEKMKGHSTVSVLRQLEESQWWTKEELERYQLQRLQNLIKETCAQVPYYRTLMKEQDLRPEDICSLLDLRKLPLLTKSVIRENSDLLKSDNSRYLQRFNTGGSSGEPLIFFIGKERVSHDVAAKWRATRWWDVDIGDREIVVWGSPIELGAQDTVRKFRDKILRTKLIPAFEMSETNLDHFVDEIRSFSPVMLFGYPSSLSLIAKHADKKNIDLKNIGIKAAFVTSERLFEDQKKCIERVFNCPVANGYGGRDAGFIAHQCPSGGMHLTAEDIIVEIIDQKGQPLSLGQEGEIVVTHLATKDFPFIRYRTGDIGMLTDEQCSCGRGLPLLAEIKGRTTDFVVARDGTVMHGLALIYVLRDIEGVKEFKIIQNDIGKTTVQIVQDDKYRKASEETIRKEFKKRLGDKVEVNIEYLDKIPMERSGKFRYVVSNVTIE